MNESLKEDNHALIMQLDKFNKRIKQLEESKDEVRITCKITGIILLYPTEKKDGLTHPKKSPTEN